jgi:hypothetical protein
LQDDAAFFPPYQRKQKEAQEQTASTVDKGHGRREYRRLTSTTAVWCTGSGACRAGARGPGCSRSAGACAGGCGRSDPERDFLDPPSRGGDNPGTPCSPRLPEQPC